MNHLYRISFVCLIFVALATGCGPSAPTGPAAVSDGDIEQLKLDQQRVDAEERAQMKSSK